MAAYFYFVVDYATGTPREVFRSTIGGMRFYDGVIQRAKQDGTWSAEDADVRPLFDLWLKGDFDPQDDEVPELEAYALLDRWSGGNWPGR